MGIVLLPTTGSIYPQYIERPSSSPVSGIDTAFVKSSNPENYVLTVTKIRANRNSISIDIDILL